MAEQNKVSPEREALEVEAKELKLKGVHLCGDAKLKEKIAEAKAKAPEEAPRKMAPKMNVSNLNENTRSSKAKQVEAANPGCKVIYKKAGTTTEQLKALGLEFTGDYCKNDMICITDGDSFTEWQDEKKKNQRRMMDSIDEIGTKIKSHTSNKKAPPHGESEE